MRNTLIYGCMFAGKTESLIKIYRKLTKKGKKPFTIKHAIDKRYNSANITSHSGYHIVAHSFSKLMEIPEEKYKDSKYVIIDEGQFFDDLLEFILLLNSKNIIWIVAGLNLTAKGEKFGQILDLERYAAVTMVLKAICATCNKNLASLTHKKVDDDKKIEVGGAELYEPMCIGCIVHS